MKKALYYLLLFLLFQLGGGIIVNLALIVIYGQMDNGHFLASVVGGSAVSSILTIVFFIKKKYVSLSSDYIKSRPWGVLSLIALLSLALLIPSAFVQELFPESLTKDVLKDVFKQLVASPFGYIVIGICAPLTEELVFRGAVLRTLLQHYATDNSTKRVWGCIAFSALFFSFTHMNPAQMPHAFVIGLLLGWLYYHTGSILPGLVCHWINNSAAFALGSIFPELDYDAKLIEYFDGNEQNLYCTLAFSVCLAVLLLFCLNKHFKTTETL